MQNSPLFIAFLSDVESLARKWKEIFSAAPEEQPTPTPEEVKKPRAQKPAVVPSVPAPTPSPAPTATPEPAPAAAPTATPAPTMTLADFQASAVQILQRHGGDQTPVRAVLDAFGLEKPAQLRPEQYEPFLSAMRKAFGEE